MERMKVPVKVSPIIREYIMDVNNGSDVIVPSRGDLMWGYIKQYLETAPTSTIELEKDSHYIYVELLDCHSTRCYSRQSDRTIFMNTLFRWNLSAEGQNKIHSALKKNFKAIMHTFIMGQLSANPEMQQREAMEEFCSTFNLSMQNITPDMIKKSWDRSDHKKKLHDNSVRLNAIFF